MCVYTQYNFYNAKCYIHTCLYKYKCVYSVQHSLVQQFYVFFNNRCFYIYFNNLFLFYNEIKSK